MNKTIEKDELVRIAGELFRQKGYSATSIDDIARGCGVTKGSLYHHFAGKEALALAALEQVHAHYRAHIFSIVLDSAQPGADELARFNTAVETFFARHPYGCLLANLSLEIGGGFELFRSRIVAFFDDWTACYRKVFSGYLPAADAAARADDAIAIVQGCVLMYRIHGQLAPLRRQHARLREMLA
jgi:AcrR family transcriptional regulator